jgi:putative FmdB family regulatory protein
MTYTYRCDACRQRYDVEQRITEDRLDTCPKCGAPNPVREINGGAFILKGERWYKDGYSGGGGSSEG